mmetsp:Transcript_20072/g.51112  ORF Transcript_20072/g.51112 Transcript_20072/m.51112 type:complete len:230 (+) Transcript_20072:270-959(+)
MRTQSPAQTRFGTRVCSGGRSWKLPGENQETAETERPTHASATFAAPKSGTAAGRSSAMKSSTMSSSDRASSAPALYRSHATIEPLGVSPPQFSFCTSGSHWSWSSIKKVPPAPRSCSNFAKTLAGVRVFTYRSNHRRTEITSMPCSEDAAANSGHSRARSGDPRTTERIPLTPRARTTPVNPVSSPCTTFPFFASRRANVNPLARTPPPSRAGGGGEGGAFPSAAPGE